MNITDWEEKKGTRRLLTEMEKKKLSKAVVIENELGEKSLCFTMSSGGHTFIPLSKYCKVLADTEVPLDKIELYIIERYYEEEHFHEKRIKADIKSD